MSSPVAARVDDPIEHSPGLAGFAAGAIIGAALAVAVAVAVVGTGGAALVVVVAAGAVGGGIVGEVIARLACGGIETGVLTTGTSDVEINGKLAVRMSDAVEPCWVPVIYPHGATFVVEGSMTVLINCLPAARVGDELMCGAYIAAGSPDVVIGGPKGRINGTGPNFWTGVTFVLERVGLAAFATQIAIFPGSGLLSLAGIAAFQASYDFYKGWNEGISGGIESVTGIHIDPAWIGLATEVGISAVAGRIAQRVPGLNWNALQHVEKAQAWARYAQRPNAGWGYARWAQNYEHLMAVRPFPTHAQAFQAAVGDVLDWVQNGASLLKTALDQIRSANSGPTGCACGTDWYSAKG